MSIKTRNNNIVQNINIMLKDKTMQAEFTSHPEAPLSYVKKEGDYTVSFKDEHVHQNPTRGGEAILITTTYTKVFSKEGARTLYRKGKYTQWSTGPNGFDICGYCGFENGGLPYGKTRRYGWDCGGCGSN
jgi:hypothetical protein